MTEEGEVEGRPDADAPEPQVVLNGFRRLQLFLEAEWEVHKRFWELVAAGAVLVVVAVQVVMHWGFFAAPPPRPTGGAPWNYLFGSRLAVGAIRLAVFGFGVFVVASLAGLLVAGRWASGFGRDGVKTDDAAKANQAIDDLKRVIARQSAFLGVVNKENRKLQTVVKGIAKEEAVKPRSSTEV
jgi:hypothetical protein